MAVMNRPMSHITKLKVKSRHLVNDLSHILLAEQKDFRAIKILVGNTKVKFFTQSILQCLLCKEKLEEIKRWEEGKDTSWIKLFFC